MCIRDSIVTVFYFIYKFEWFEKMSFVLVTSFFIYYLIYIFVPVAGPQFYFPAIGFDNVSKGIFPAIGDYFNNKDVYKRQLCIYALPDWKYGEIPRGKSISSLPV